MANHPVTGALDALEQQLKMNNLIDADRAMDRGGITMCLFMAMYTEFIYPLRREIEDLRMESNEAHRQ